MTNERLSISELARATEVSTHTLRYYEKIGLMPAVERTLSGGHRRYSRRYVGWVRFLRRLRAAGMPVNVLRQYVEALNRDEEGSWPARRKILVTHRDEVAQQIERLQDHLMALDRKLEKGCDPGRELPGD
ncbi:MAG: MerR family transcriptional regulator [Acidobacteriota bacterium]